MPAELAGNYVLAELLLDTSFIILRDLDNTIDVAVDISFVNVL